MFRRPIESGITVSSSGPIDGSSNAVAQSAHQKGETLFDRVNRAKARWLKRVMYETSATSTEKCFAYAVVDHLNCVTLDCWPGQLRFVQLLGCKCVKTPQRAARGLERLGVLTLTRSGGNRYRYAPVFRPGDEDKNISARRQQRPVDPDRNVSESLLSIRPTSSSSTEVASKGSKQGLGARPTYNPRQRGAIEIRLASMLGKDGFNVLARLAALDDAAVDRLCRAYAEGRLGERELHAARLAVDQM